MLTVALTYVGNLQFEYNGRNLCIPIMLARVWAKPPMSPGNLWVYLYVSVVFILMMCMFFGPMLSRNYCNEIELHYVDPRNS